MEGYHTKIFPKNMFRGQGSAGWPHLAQWHDSSKVCHPSWSRRSRPKQTNPILEKDQQAGHDTLTFSLNSFSIRIRSWSVPVSRSPTVEESMFVGREGEAQLRRHSVRQVRQQPEVILIPATHHARLINGKAYSMQTWELNNRSSLNKV